MKADRRLSVIHDEPMEEIPDPQFQPAIAQPKIAARSAVLPIVSWHCPPAAGVQTYRVAVALKKTFTPLPLRSPTFRSPFPSQRSVGY